MQVSVGTRDVGNVAACVSHDPIVDVAHVCKPGSDEVSKTWPLYASSNLIKRVTLLLDNGHVLVSNCFCCKSYFSLPSTA